MRGTILSNQPKPATTKPSAWALRQVDKNMDDAVDRMFPKPTTAEWTAADVLQMGCDRADPAYAIADAHNAAIAAEADGWRSVISEASKLTKETFTDERKKLTQLHDEWFERVQDLNKQLAAEREKVEFRDAVIKQRTEALHRFQEQLAAERERTAMHVRNWDKMLADKDQQLAASVHYWQGVATQEWHKGFGASHDEHQKQLAALVDALTTIAKGLWPPNSAKLASAALAKVKEAA
jgi:hypothetical protein